MPKADLAAQRYDLSLNRYKEVVHPEVVHRPPGEILASLTALEKEIVHGMRELALAAGSRPLPDVEIYTDERLAEFAKAESELGEVLSRKGLR